MILGLDVGGTQTDSVLIHDGAVVYKHKSPTKKDLLDTLRTVIGHAVAEVGAESLRRMVFSTTLATNAIIQNALFDAGMIVTAGPGMDPSLFAVGPSFHIVEGALDHRGAEVMAPNKKAVYEAADAINAKNIDEIGIVGKFSVRNPTHEEQISQWLSNYFPTMFLGHQISGILNFPRRITTTYLNAALSKLHNQFFSSLVRILDEQKLKPSRYLLKPDGGTIHMDQTMGAPVMTAQSGPSASVMGALALDGCPDTALVLDIGGTTTDMSVVLRGTPLLEPFGIRLGPYRTLVRSLRTHSVGIGGDSEIQLGKDGTWTIGPLRQGPPLAFGGTVPTPTDAMIVLGMIKRGDRTAAMNGMKELGLSVGADAEATAQSVLEQMGRGIAASARAFVERINARPVYTIDEVLHQQEIRPDAAVVIGGPAPYLAKYVGEALELPYRVPRHSGVANAVGAALSRVTSEITLQADTERGFVVIPEANVHESIDSRFGDREALAMAETVLRRQITRRGGAPDNLEISVIENQVFNMIRGASNTGKNIRLKMSVVPGIISEWKRRQGSRD